MQMYEFIAVELFNFVNALNVSESGDIPFLVHEYTQSIIDFVEQAGN